MSRRVDIGRQAELGQAHVSNIIQDSVGFVWLATWNGLLRYDGYSVHSFKPIMCSDGTIDSNRIYNIKFSRSGSIWCVSSDNRLFYFDPQTCRFANLSQSIDIIADKKVKVLTPLKNGFTWVTFADGSMLRLNDNNPLEGMRWYDSPSKVVRGAKKINGVELSVADDEWILTDAGAFNFTRRKVVPGNYAYVEYSGGNTYLIGHDGVIVEVESGHKLLLSRGEQLNVTDRLRDGNRLFISTDKGVFQFDLSNRSIVRYSSRAWSDLFKDMSHRIWAVDDGSDVMLIENAASKVFRLLSTAGRDRVLGLGKSFMFESPEGDVILNTKEGVMSAYNPALHRLEPVRGIKDVATGLENVEVKKFMADSTGNLWLLESSGLSCLRFSRGIFEHIQSSPVDETRSLAVDSHGSLWRGDRSGNVTAGDFSITTGPAYVIKESPRGEIWIGTKGNGLFVLDRDSAGRIINTSHFKSGTVHSDTIYDIAFDRDGTAWIGSYGNGLGKAIFKDGGWQFGKVPGQPIGMKVRSILPCDNGCLLIATTEGLVATDAPVAARPKFFVNKYRKEPWGLKGNDVMRVVECGGEYYAAVFGAGVSRLDSRDLLSDSLHFTHYKMAVNSDADQIRSAIAVGDEIFIFAGHTVSRLSTSTGHLSEINPAAFMDGASFSESLPVSLDGMLIAGVTDGLLSFDPNAFVEEYDGGRLALTGIVYQNQIDVTPLYNPSYIHIPPQQRNFTLMFSDFNFAAPGRSIRYRFENDRGGWTYMNGGRPMVSFNNIAPGTHKIIFEIDDGIGKWVSAMPPLTIDVEARFVEKPIFKMLVAALIAGMLVGLSFVVVYFRRMRNAVQRRYSLLMAVDRISDTGREEVIPDMEDESRVFIEKTVKFLNDNLTNPDLVIEDFAKHLGMSRTGFYNRMKELTGCSPVEFVRQIRIKNALQLLNSGSMTVAEVAYSVGYSDPKYFARCFKAEMDMTPTQYMSASSEGEKK